MAKAHNELDQNVPQSCKTRQKFLTLFFQFNILWHMANSDSKKLNWRNFLNSEFCSTLFQRTQIYQLSMNFDGTQLHLLVASTHNMFVIAHRTWRKQVHLLWGTPVAQRLFQLQEVLGVSGGQRFPHRERWHPVSRVWQRHLKAWLEKNQACTTLKTFKTKALEKHETVCAMNTFRYYKILIVYE